MIRVFSTKSFRLLLLYIKSNPVEFFVSVEGLCQFCQAGHGNKYQISPNNRDYLSQNNFYSERGSSLFFFFGEKQLFTIASISLGTISLILSYVMHEIRTYHTD